MQFVFSFLVIFDKIFLRRVLSKAKWRTLKKIHLWTPKVKNITDFQVSKCTVERVIISSRIFPIKQMSDK